MCSYVGIFSIQSNKDYFDGNLKLEFYCESELQIQSAVGLVLSVLRYDSLFDYSSELEDPLAREIVYKYHCKLIRTTQPKIERKNKRRLQEGHLTYPYLIPRWLPNGVQT